MIAGVLIAYAEQPGLTLDELKAGFEGLVSLFTLLEEPVVVRDRRIISFPDMRVSDYACEDRWLSTQRHGGRGAAILGGQQMVVHLIRRAIFHQRGKCDKPSWLADNCRERRASSRGCLEGR